MSEVSGKFTDRAASVVMQTVYWSLAVKKHEEVFGLLVGLRPCPHQALGGDQKE